MRGLIRLVRPELGKEYGRANRALREAAEAAMSSEPIPPGYRDTIRTYFDASRED